MILVSANYISRRRVLHHHIELASGGGLGDPHPQVGGGRPDQLGKVPRFHVHGFSRVVISLTLFIPTCHWLRSLKNPSRITAPTPVKILSIVTISTVLKSVRSCKIVCIFPSPEFVGSGLILFSKYYIREKIIEIS